MNSNNTEILTKEEYAIWKKEHKNKNHYTFYKNNIKLYSEWLENRDDAKNIIDNLQTGSSDTFYYKTTTPHIIKKSDEYVVCNHLNDVFLSHKPTSWLGKINEKVINVYYYITYRIPEKLNCFIKDICYFIKNYNWECQYSHNRLEWYSIIDHIINDLKYNIPIMIKNGHSYPTEFTNIDEWHDKLKQLLLYIQKYDFYRWYYSEEKCTDEYKKMGEEFVVHHNNLNKAIPYYENSKDINYNELDKIVQKTWDNIIDWLKKYGQNLWD